MLSGKRKMKSICLSTTRESAECMPEYSKRMMVIGWNKADNIPPIRTNIDLLVTVKDDVWHGSSFASLSMIDWRLSE